MTTNRNPDTGIRYGYISANSLDGDVVHDLMYGRQAKNLSYEEAEEEETARQQGEFDAAVATLSQYVFSWEPPTFEPALGNFEPCIDEPTVEGVYEGVKYRSSWLGGALHFFIFESPYTLRYRHCSPCVPGAGDLNTPDADGVLTYDVPPDWRFVEIP